MNHIQNLDEEMLRSYMQGSEPRKGIKGWKEPERVTERARERVRESQRESVRASESLRETESARESQGENQREPERAGKEGLSGITYYFKRDAVLLQDI